MHYYSGAPTHYYSGVDSPAATAVTEKNMNRLSSGDDESQSHQKPLDTEIPIQVLALTLAAVATHATGTPSPVTATWYWCLSCRGLSGWVRQARPHAAAVQDQDLSRKRFAFRRGRRATWPRAGRAPAPARHPAPRLPDGGAGSSRWLRPRSPSGCAMVCPRAGTATTWRARVWSRQAGAPARAGIAPRSTQPPLRSGPKS